jgi:hypothetical protein
MKSNARENQDLIALCLFNCKKGGTYLEIGAQHSVLGSNTYLLETDFNWTGVSVEWDTHLAGIFNSTRQNKCVCQDATTIDYNELIESNINIFKNQPIDFLQLDIEPSANTFKVFQKIDFNKHTFSFITYEHDTYDKDNEERKASRKLLEEYGYTRFFSDVCHSGIRFEDWYVNEKTIPNDNWKQFIYDTQDMNTNNMSQEIKDKISNIVTPFLYENNKIEFSYI